MNTDIQIFADTIYGEARGEYHKLDVGLAGLMAVGNVITNRLLSGQWGHTYAKVCQSPHQFSCWNVDDPNLQVITDPARLTDPVYLACQKIATALGITVVKEHPTLAALYEFLDPADAQHTYIDITNGALYYYSSTMKTAPSWSPAYEITLKLGLHTFLRPPY